MQVDEIQRVRVLLSLPLVNPTNIKTGKPVRITKVNESEKNKNQTKFNEIPTQNRTYSRTWLSRAFRRHGLIWSRYRLRRTTKNKNKTLTTIPKLRQGKDISKASIIHEAIEHEDGHQQSVLLITSNPKINLCNLNFELHNM